MDEQKLQNVNSLLAQILGDNIDLGLNFNTSLADSNAVKSRNRVFTDFIEKFVIDYERRAKQQRVFRCWFFCIVVVVFIILNVLSSCSVYIIAQKANVSISDVVAAVSAFGTILSSLIVLPKIIAEHLFPKAEQDKSIELFSKVLEEDQKVREFYDGRKASRRKTK
jgi:hypothetical protein